MGKKRIMGLDPGHGESAAYIYEVNSTTAPEPLSLDADQYKVLPSAISYKRNDGTDDKAIGRVAATRDDVCCYFKTAPGKWLDSNGKPVLNNGRPVKNLMGDFIGQLYKQIETYNRNSPLLEDDEIVLYVGCPSSTTWTAETERREYEELIRSVTGLPLDHVHVVEESTAAVFNSFLGNVTDICVNDGVIVFDFGSSTADSTYIRTGEVKLENSWTLGASEIERAMLKLLLEQANLSQKDIYAPDINKILLALRTFKERYYSGSFGKNNVVSVRVPLVDANGNFIPFVKRNGQTAFREVYLTPQKDMDDFMDEATGFSKFRVTEKGQDKGEYTWEKGCEAFMEQMRDYIKAQGYPCCAVVLTGGASKMPFVRSVAEKVFVGLETTMVDGTKKKLTAENIFVDNVPSISVARGLCVIGQTDMELPSIKNRLTAEIVGPRKTAFESEVINATAEAIASKAIDEALSTLKGIDHTITVSELNERVETAVSSSCNTAATARIEKEIKNWKDHTAQVITTRVNEESGKMYHGLLPQGAITLPSDNVKKELEFDFTGNLSIDLDFNSTFMKIIADIVAVIVGGVVAAVVPIPFLNLIAGAIAFAVAQEIILNNPNKVLEPKDISRAVNRVTKDRSKYMEQFKTRIKTKLSEALNVDDFTAPLSKIISDSLDIVALKQFVPREKNDH